MFGCHNNEGTLKKWKTSQCEEHKVINGTDSCDCKWPFFLTTFPTKDKDLKEEWIKRINRKDWKPNYDTRICSDHFVDVDLVRRKLSKDHPYLTINLGYEPTGDKAKQKRKSPPIRLKSPPVKRKNSRKVIQDISVETEIDNQCCDCEVYKAKIKELQKEVLYWQKRYQRKHHKRISLEVLSNDKKVKSYTGLPSKKVFDTLFETFGDKVKKIRKWQGPGVVSSRRPSFHGTKRNSYILTAKEEYFLTLFRTKTMIKGDILGDLFGISASWVSQICTTWWKFLSTELKPLIYNPSPESHRALLPVSFNTPQYKKVEHIVDCTEVFTETPKNKKVQALLWSNYKHHYTSKFLVSVTPTGLINFASKGYGGRASDRQIVEHSGFMEEVRPGECVMADKGFNITDLLTLKHAHLVIPPG